MHQATVKKNHRACWPGGTDDAAFFSTGALHQLRNQIIVNRPKWITGRGQVVLGIDHAFFMAARNKHQGAVELVDIV